MRTIKYAGTLIPLFLLVTFVLGLESALDGSLTWERPAVYGFTVVSLIFGQVALIQMSRFSLGDNPSLLLLLLNYENAALLATYLGILAAAMKSIYPESIFALPDPVIFGFLVSASATLGLTRFILYFGRKRGWIEAPVDPMPGGAFRSDDVKTKLERVAQKQDDHIELTEQRFVAAEKHAEEVKARLDVAATQMDEKLAGAVEERELMQKKLDEVLGLLRLEEED